MKKTEIIYISCLILIFCILSISTIIQKSVGFDEVIFPAAGYMYWTKGDYSLNVENPPLAKLLVSLPLLFLKLDIPDVCALPKSDPYYQFSFGSEFLTKNKISQKMILLSTRLVIVTISIIFSIVIYLYTKKMLGIAPAVIGIILYLFFPNILAYSSLATTDLLLSFFVFYLSFS